MLEFEWVWLFILIPLPWLVHRFSPPLSTNQAALKVPFLDDFSDPLSTFSQRKNNNKILLGLALLAWVGLVTAVARPQWVGDPIELPVEGRDIMLAVDLSGSMEEQDFSLSGNRIDRLTATKVVAGKFIKQRIGDRIGLILFGTRAYLQTPLTFDRKTVITLLHEAVTRIAGDKTAIGDAIGLAVKRLQDNQGERILILLSDGENTAGEISPLKAAELAAREGLKIYTIGIGPDTGSGDSFYGMLLNSAGPGFDEKTLTLIAQKTGGHYFHASNTQELAQVYSQIDAMEPIESDSRVYRPVDSLFYWPLGIALILSFLVILIRGMVVG